MRSSLLDYFEAGSAKKRPSLALKIVTWLYASPYMPQQPLKSGFIDELMPNATEEERVDATKRYFRILELLIKMADTHAETCEQCQAHSGSKFATMRGICTRTNSFPSRQPKGRSIERPFAI
jgi:hypothetical protein